MTIGERVVKFRQMKGFSQNDLAEAIGVTQGYISHIELGRRLPSFNDLDTICKVFNITMGQFFADTELPTSVPPDIAQFAIDPKNQALIRMIQGMRNAGYTNEVIEEWIVSLNLTLDNITDQLKKRYGIGKGEGQTRWVDEDLLPEEERGKYSEEEKRELTEKLKKKLGRN